MLKRKLLSSLVLIALVSGCDIDDDNEDTPRSLVGLWSSECIANDSNPDFEYSYKITIEYTENEYIEQDDFYYHSLVCDADTSSQSTYSGTYEIGESVVTPTGVDATEIDIVLTEITTSSNSDIEDVDYTLLDLFVIEGTYLYLGGGLGGDGARPEDIDYSFSLELQE